MAVLIAYKCVAADYTSSWRDAHDVVDGAAAFTAHPVTYTVGESAEGDPGFEGVYVWVDATGAPVGNFALARAIGTASAMEVHHLPVGSAPVAGTRGRVLQVSYDDADVLDPVYPNAPYPSFQAGAFSLTLRVATCQVVAEIAF